MPDESLGTYWVGAGLDVNQLNAGVNAAISNLQQAADRMAAAMGGAVTKIDESLNKFQQNMQNAGTKGKNTADEVSSKWEKTAAKINAAAGLIGIAVAGAFGKAIKTGFEYTLQVSKMAEATGMTTEQVSKLAYAADLNEVPIENLKIGMGALSRQLLQVRLDASGSTGTFGQFGIKVKDTQGKLLPMEQIVGNIADRFKSMKDGPTKAGLAMSLFGKQGQALIPILNQGSEGLRKMGADAESLGVVIKNTDTMNQYDDAMDKMGMALKGMAIQVFQAASPALSQLAGVVTRVFQAFNSLSPGLQQAIIKGVGIAGVFMAVNSGVSGLKSLLGPFGNLLGGVAGKFTDIGKAGGFMQGGLMKLLGFIPKMIGGLISLIGKLVATHVAWLVGMGPVGWVILAIEAVSIVVAAFVAAWSKNFLNIREAASKVWDGVLKAFKDFLNIFKTLATGFWDILKGLGKAILMPWKAGEAWEDMKAGFSAIADAWKGQFRVLADVAGGVASGVATVGQSLGGAIKTAMNKLKGGSTGGVPTAPTIPGASTPYAGEGSDETYEPQVASGDQKSAYEQAKALYQQDVDTHQYTQAEKLAIYQKYLADVKKSSEEQMDYEKGLYDSDTAAQKEALDIQKAQLENQLATGLMSEEDMHAAKMALLQKEVAQFKEGSLERIQAEKAVIEEEKRHLDVLKEINKEIQKGQQDHALALLQIEKDRLDTERELGLISEEEYIQRMAAIEDRAYQLKLAALQAEQALYQQGSLEWQRIQNQIDALNDAHNEARLNALDESLKAQLSLWQGLFDSLNSSFQNIINGILNGEMTFRKAMYDIVEGVQQFFVKMAVDVATNWLKSLFTRKAASTADNAEQVAATTATETAIQGVKAGSAAAQVAMATAGNKSEAALAAATAAAVVDMNAAAFGATLGMITALAAAVALIPPMGPEIAAGMLAGVGAASAALATSVGTATAAITASFGAAASLDVGTMSVPRDMLAMVHRREVVVPPAFSDRARQVLTGEMIPAGAAAGGKGAGGDTYNISTLDPRSWRDFIRRRGREAIDETSTHVRRHYQPRNKRKW